MREAAVLDFTYLAPFRYDSCGNATMRVEVENRVTFVLWPASRHLWFDRKWINQILQSECRITPAC